MFDRVLLKANGKKSFKRNYWPCVAVAIFMGLLETGFSFQTGRESASTYMNGVSDFDMLLLMTGILGAASIIGILVYVFIANVIRVGGNHFFIKNRESDPNIRTVIEVFRSGEYGNVVLTMFIMDLKVFLWTLLFIIPGIIKSYEYMMVPYILAENPGMNHKDAFAISKKMMDGRKMDAFILDLSFIGWHILAIFTFGILEIFYVNPYIQATKAELYAFNKAMAYQEGFIH